MSLFVEYENSRKITSIFNDFHLTNDILDVQKCLHVLTEISKLEELFKPSIDVPDTEHELTLNKVFSDMVYYNSNIFVSIFSEHKNYKFPQEIYKKFSRYPLWNTRYHFIKNNSFPTDLLREISELDPDPDVRNRASIYLVNRT